MNLKTISILILFLLIKQNLKSQIDSINSNVKGKILSAVVNEKTNDLYCLSLIKIYNSTTTLYFNKFNKNTSKWEITDSFMNTNNWSPYEPRFYEKFYKSTTEMISNGNDIFVSILTENNSEIKYYYFKFDGSKLKFIDFSSSYSTSDYNFKSNTLFKWQKKVYTYSQKSDNVYELTSGKSILNTSLTNLVADFNADYFKIISNKDRLVIAKSKSYGMTKPEEYILYTYYSVYNSTLNLIDSNTSLFYDFLITAKNKVILSQNFYYNVLKEKTKIIYNKKLNHTFFYTSNPESISNNKFDVFGSNLAFANYFAMSKDSGSSINTDFSIAKKNKINIFSNDSSISFFVLDTLNTLFFFKQEAYNVFFNTRFKSIQKINLDSINGLKQLDTVLIYAFHDNNNNGIFDKNDDNFNYINSQGTYPKEIIILDDNDLEINFRTLSNNKSYCYVNSQFTLTNQISNISNSKKSKDTLVFIQRPVNDLTLGSYLDNYRRVDLFLDMYFYPMTLNCNTINTNSTLKIYVPNNAIYKDTIGSQTSGVVSRTIPVSELNKHYACQIKFPFGFYKLGDTIKVPVEIENSQDTFLDNNFDTLSFVLSYSYDPNGKQCNPAGMVEYPVKNLTYQIDFQNEGTDYANTVVVLDTLDTRMPLYDVIVCGASHPYTLSVRGNVIRWEFKNINLKPKTENEKESKGFIVFKTRLKTKLAINAQVKNRVGIYFDKNDAVLTNWATVTRGPLNGNAINTKKILKKENQLHIYPNPAKQTVSLLNNSPQTQSIQITDTQGKLITKLSVAGSETITLSVENVSPGVYYIKNGNTTQKLIVNH